MSMKQWWLIVIFFSGAAGLAYEVLWFRELSVLFGSSVSASAILPTLFFLGLSLGAYGVGKSTFVKRNPVAAYAFLEWGVAVSAFLYLLFFAFFRGAYEHIHVFASGNPLLLLIIKFFCAGIFLLPPAFCMGGTLPAVAQVFWNKRDEFGRTGSVLYGVNTFGAVLGTFVAGFFLLPAFGFRKTYFFIMLVNVLLGCVVFFLGRRTPHISREDTMAPSKGRMETRTVPQRTVILACASGALFLGAEIIWIQGFALAGMNDVYSFTTVLVLLLLSIVAGSALAYRLHGLPREPETILRYLLWGAGIALMVSPLLLTSFVPSVFGAERGAWLPFVFSVLGAASLSLLIPGILMGSIFPYLFRTIQSNTDRLGEGLGVLLFWNTLGAAIGSLGTGFILLGLLGTWKSAVLLGGVYLSLGLVCTHLTLKRVLVSILAYAGIGIVVVVGGFSEVALRVTDNEVLKKLYRGRDGFVAVIEAHPKTYPRDFNDLFMRLNNSYTLGGRGSSAFEERQAHLPLFLFGEAKRLFFLGMGTGITAGAALTHDILEVTVAEISPQVVRAAREHFAPFTNGLFEDPRAHLFIEDGRNYLFGNPMTYDLIIADLFDSHTAGVDNLYTKEHMLLVKKRLNPHGAFIQWLPLYQLTPYEFGVIANTFLAVFPHVTLWRGNFDPLQPAVALVGDTSVRQLDPTAFLNAVNVFGKEEHRTQLTDFIMSVRGLGMQAVSEATKDPRFIEKLVPHLAARTPLSFYAGNITTHAERFNIFPINTDNRPLVEFSMSRKWDTEGGARGFSHDELRTLYETLFTPDDPYLARLSKKEFSYVRAGKIYADFVGLAYEAENGGGEEKATHARKAFDAYLDLMELRKVMQ